MLTAARSYRLGLVALVLTLLVLLYGIGALGVVVLAGGLAEGASTLDVVGLTAMFACLYGGAAWLFHRATGGGRRTTSG